MKFKIFTCHCQKFAQGVSQPLFQCDNLLITLSLSPLCMESSLSRNSFLSNVIKMLLYSFFNSVYHSAGKASGRPQRSWQGFARQKW
jgi:hypothetical protein